MLARGEGAPNMLSLVSPKRLAVPTVNSTTLDARGEVPVTGEPEPLRYSFILPDDNFRFGKDACSEPVETCEGYSCILCLRTGSVEDLNNGKSLSVGIVIEDTWGYPRMRMYSYVEIMQEIVEDLSTIKIEPFNSGRNAQCTVDWFKAQLKENGITITASNFVMSEAAEIANFIVKVMDTSKRSASTQEYISQEINAYLALTEGKPQKWTVVMDTTREPITWNIKASEYKERSFITFEREERKHTDGRKYYVFRAAHELGRVKVSDV